MKNPINVYKLRKLIVGINRKVPLMDDRSGIEINFDNGATTPPLLSVVEAVNRYLPYYSSIHRGVGYKSRVSTWIYEKARERVADFVRADFNKDVVIFTSNTTQAINKMARRLFQKEGRGLVLSTAMEHHSNDLPWRSQFDLDYIGVDQYGRLDIKDLEYKLEKYKGKVKLVTVTGASNVTGYINPVYKIAKLAHQYGARIFVDGAQLVPHVSVDMKAHDDPEHIDFLAFSGHKMYAPFGTGVLIGHKDFFEGGRPSEPGGGTVKFVSHKDVLWNDAPLNEEAGSPNAVGVVALAEAIKFLKKIGMENIYQYETKLSDYAIRRLREIDDIIIYGEAFQKSGRVGIISFNIKGLPHEVTALALAYEGAISVRSGCFCAQPYVQKLLDISEEESKGYMKNDKGRPGLVRISFGFYNTFQEIDQLIRLLKIISKNKSYFIKKYGISE